MRNLEFFHVSVFQIRTIFRLHPVATAALVQQHFTAGDPYDASGSVVVDGHAPRGHREVGFLVLLGVMLP